MRRWRYNLTLAIAGKNYDSSTVCRAVGLRRAQSSRFAKAGAITPSTRSKLAQGRPLTFHLSLSLPRIRHAPHRAVPILGHQKSAVVGNGYTNRPAPDAIVVYHKAGEKVVILAGGDTVINADTYDFVTGADTPIPRTMESSENISVIFSRERGYAASRGVEHHF